MITQQHTRQTSCLDRVPARICDSLPITNQCRGVVLAGVHAWGADPLDSVVCRPLWPIMGRPLIRYGVDWLANNGVSNVVICANSNTRHVRAELGEGSAECTLTYYEDHLPRGPAGCVRDAAGESNRLVIAVEGTNVPSFSLAEIHEHHHKTNAALTVAVAPNAARTLRRPTLRPAGVYIFSPQVLDEIGSAGYHDIKEGIIPRIRAAGGRVSMFRVSDDSALHVGDTPSYFAASRRLLYRACEAAFAGGDYSPSESTLIHDSARVDSSARLIGPVLVGHRARVGSNAVVLGPTILGEDSEIGSGAVVANSILWNGVGVGESASVDGCVLTNNCRVKAGSVSRNCVLRSVRPRPSSLRNLSLSLSKVWERLSLLKPPMCARGW